MKIWHLQTENPLLKFYFWNDYTSFFWMIRTKPVKKILSYTLYLFPICSRISVKPLGNTNKQNDLFTWLYFRISAAIQSKTMIINALAQEIHLKLHVNWFPGCLTILKSNFTYETEFRRKHHISKDELHFLNYAVQ